MALNAPAESKPNLEELTVILPVKSPSAFPPRIYGGFHAEGLSAEEKEAHEVTGHFTPADIERFSTREERVITSSNETYKRVDGTVCGTPYGSVSTPSHEISVYVLQYRRAGQAEDSSIPWVPQNF